MGRGRGRQDRERKWYYRNAQGEQNLEMTWKLLKTLKMGTYALR